MRRSEETCCRYIELRSAPCTYPAGIERALSTMSPSTGIDAVETLVPEIERYLRIVEYFRSEGCEPHWAREDAQSVWSTPDAGSLPPAVGAETA